MWRLFCLPLVADIVKIVHGPFFLLISFLAFVYLMCGQDNSSSSGVPRDAKRLDNPALDWCMKPGLWICWGPRLGANSNKDWIYDFVYWAASLAMREAGSLIPGEMYMWPLPSHVVLLSFRLDCALSYMDVKTKYKQILGVLVWFSCGGPKSWCPYWLDSHSN